ncbi:MAG: flagellar biosynthesis protein FlhA [Treponema sp.]|nr:flagellar biosynthesis protein FlhA [Treponema sp.]
MANENRGRIFNFLQHNIVGVAVVLVVFCIFIPMPKLIIDVSMVLNLAASIIVLLVVVYTPRASNFQTFPRVVLYLTLFGLAVNISSTRLILSAKSMREQSDMVKAFSDIVAGGDAVIGFVIFIIIIVVQVLVVTKGAGRVSEVAARFSLDSMNQKFFDVDNRLNSGAISEEEALAEKDAIRKEIDFYSAMDGSSKFVSGNVKAGIFITVINLVGGIAVNMLPGRSGNSSGFGSILSMYSSLTIGDGLLSQLPSLMISFATGLLVTGSKSDERFDSQLKSDFSRSGYIYIILGAILLAMGIIMGIFMHHYSLLVLFIPIGALFVYIGSRLKAAETSKIAAQKISEEKQKEQNQVGTTSADAEKIAMLDPLSLELGYALIPLVDKKNGAELLERIARIREEAKLDMGFVIPKIRIQDNMTLDPNEYSFKIKGIEAGHAQIRLGYYMCMDNGAVITPLQGEKTKDPSFGMSAIWLPEDRRAEAEEAGYLVVDPPTIIATHITEIIRSHAAEMLGRQEVSAIMDVVKEKKPILVDEVLNTAKLTYGQIEKVLQNLLEEKVSIRNIDTILETLANYASISHNPWDLTAKVRESLGLQICSQYVDADKRLRVMTLSQPLSELLKEHEYIPADGSKPYVAFDPVDRRKWIKSVSDSISRVQEKGFQPIILCVSPVRQLVRSSLEQEMPGVVVLSEMELYAAGRNISVDVIDEIS